MPASTSGQLLCSHSNNRDEFWVSLIEKAYMKVSNKYVYIVFVCVCVCVDSIILASAVIMKALYSSPWHC